MSGHSRRHTGPQHRDSEVERQVTDTQQAVTGFTFASPAHILPSTVTTGDGTTTATTSSYLFDDFGQLVEYVSPDSGTTRSEYDLAGNVVTRREAVGTADQRTVSTTYDSLGRVVAVDHDTEGELRDRARRDADHRRGVLLRCLPVTSASRLHLRHLHQGPDDAGPHQAALLGRDDLPPR
jgi:YD repeat-containing protein